MENVVNRMQPTTVRGGSDRTTSLLNSPWKASTYTGAQGFLLGRKLESGPQWDSDTASMCEVEVGRGEGRAWLCKAAGEAAWLLGEGGRAAGGGLRSLAAGGGLLTAVSVGFRYHC